MHLQSPIMPTEGTQRIKAHAVAAPCDHEGVGNALRSAYLPRASDMPRDIADLLEKLR